MPRFARVEVWSDFACAGGTRLAIVADRTSVITTRDVTGDDSVQLTIPRNSASVQHLSARRVLRIVRRDTANVETFDEWRLTERTRASGEDASEFRYTARSPRTDLARGEISQVLVTGESAHVFPVVAMTPSQIIDTYVLPALAAAGLGYFARGTIDPTAPLDLTFEYYSPLSLLEALLQATSTELQIRRNGTTGYYIDLLNEIGAGADRPAFRQKRNIIRNELFEQTQDQVTRCIPRGPRLPGMQEYHTIARMIFGVAAVSAGVGTLTLDVVDPAGSFEVIGFDDEFNGWFVYRHASGGTFPIVDTIKSGQQLVITSDADIVAGETIELRTSDAQSFRVPHPRMSPPPAPLNVLRLPYFSAVDGGFPKRFVLSDQNNSSPADFVVFDGQYRDLFVTFCTQILSDNLATVDGSNGRFAFVSSIAALAVDDLIYHMAQGANANPPHALTLGSTLWRVTSLDVANKYAYVVPHYDDHVNEILPNLTPQRVVVMRPAQSQRVRTSFASSDKLELTANVNAAHLGKIVLIEQWCGGVFPSYVDEPVAIQAPPSGYGIIPRVLDRSGMRGEGNLIRNPRFATWTTPANAPDGWTNDAVLGPSPQFSQNTNPAFIKYGVRSWYLTLFDDVNSKATAPVSPVFYVNPVRFTDLSRYALKISLYLEQFSGDCDLKFFLLSRSVSGTVSPIEALRFFSTDYGAVVPDNQKKASGSWQDIVIPAITPTEPRMGSGIQVQLFATRRGGTLSSTGVCKVYLDAVAAYQVSYDPGSGNYVDGSFANRLLDSAHQQLRQFAQPTVEYTTKIADLERIGAGAYPIVTGGQIDMSDADLNHVASPRVRRQVVDELDYPNTQVTLSTRVDRLTTLIAAESG